MCITKEVSLSVFLTCTISCIYLYQRNNINDRWIAILFGYIGIMQLLEYFMWKDQDCKGLNQKATKISIYFILLQPIVSFVVAYIMTNGKIPNWLYMITIIYIIYVIPTLYSKLEDNQCTKPCNGSDFGLNWAWTDIDIGKRNIRGTFVWFVFFLALISPLLLMKKNENIYFILNTVIWLLSGIIGSYRCQGITDISSGSLWCLMAFLMPLSAIYINK